MVYIAGPVFSKTNGMSYALSLDALSDFLKVSAFGRAEIGDITHDFIFKDSFNGSLWTLKIEFGFYVALALALWVMRHVAVPVMVTVFFCVTAYVLTQSASPIAPKLLVYSTLGIAFFTGSSTYFYRDLFSRTQIKMLAGVLALVLILTSLGTEWVMVLASVGVSLLVLVVGTLLNDRIIKSRFDISYGMYLYAFPVQQLMINLSGLSFYASMLASVAVVIVLATLSWRWVEKPALNYMHRRTRSRLSTTPA